MATAIRAAIDAAANRLSAGDDFDARAYGPEPVTLFAFASRNEETKCPFTPPLAEPPSCYPC